MRLILRLVRKALHDLTSVPLYSCSYYYLHECTQRFSKPEHVSQIWPLLPPFHTWALAVPPTRKEEPTSTASLPIHAQAASQSCIPVLPVKSSLAPRLEVISRLTRSQRPHVYFLWHLDQSPLYYCHLHPCLVYSTRLYATGGVGYRQFTNMLPTLQQNT